MFRPEPLSIGMTSLKCECSASFQVAECPIYGNISLQNNVDMLRPNVDAVQMPCAMGARINNGLQNEGTIALAEAKLGFGHKPPGLVLPSRIRQ